LSGQCLQFDAGLAEPRQHCFAISSVGRHDRASSPWSASASRVASGIVLTVNGAANALI
jgi:hypothetical protein